MEERTPCSRLCRRREAHSRGTRVPQKLPRQSDGVSLGLPKRKAPSGSREARPSSALDLEPPWAKMTQGCGSKPPLVTVCKEPQEADSLPGPFRAASTVLPLLREGPLLQAGRLGLPCPGAMCRCSAFQKQPQKLTLLTPV